MALVPAAALQAAMYVACIPVLITCKQHAVADESVLRMPACQAQLMSMRAACACPADFSLCLLGAEFAVVPPTAWQYSQFCSQAFDPATGVLTARNFWAPGYACQQAASGSETCFTTFENWVAEPVRPSGFMQNCRVPCLAAVPVTVRA